MSVVVVLATLILAACGSESQTPGEGEPKRTLDPRGEALRYFPASTETITLIETADPDALRALDESMSSVPAWSSIRDRMRRSLVRAGIDPGAILELSRNPAEDIDLPAPEIAFGTVPGSGTDGERALITLATERGVELDALFRKAAESGGLKSAGEFDGARIYRGPDLDFAVRDGVLIAAADVNRLQQAIARRDGDRAAQLDDAPITGLINSLPDGSLGAYSGAGPAAERMLDLITAAVEASRSGPSGTADQADPDGGSGSTGPIEAIEAALTARGQDGRIAIDMVVRTEGPELLTDEEAQPEPPAEEQPTPISIAPEDIQRALSELPPGTPLRGLSHLAPLAGAAWIEGDRVRARLISTSPAQPGGRGSR